MKKLVIIFFVFGLCSWYAPFSASSQISLKDLFSSSSIEEAVGSILGGQSLTAEALNGTWKYSKPACEFKSDDLLKKAGGALAASQIEDKLAEIYTKVGITEEMKYTFNAADSTFTITLKANATKGLGGSFQINAEEKTLTLSFEALKLITLNSVDATASLSDNNLTLLFNADKILDVIQIIASNSNNTTLKTIGQLAEQYDGMLLGFVLTKQEE